MSQSLVDRYCVAPHVAPLTAVACDSQTGARVTADELGTVAIVRPHEPFPTQVFTMGAPVRGATAISADGALVGVGDDNGTVAVYDTMDGSCLFESVKEGPAGPLRAMRALAFDPSATLLASLAIDGIVRIFDLQTWSRRGNYQGFVGDVLEFDDRGRRLLLLGPDQQLRLLDIENHEQMPFDAVQDGVIAARFTSDRKYVIALGPSDITVYGAVDLAVRYRISAQGSSGLLALALAPDGSRLAAVTGRSVHTFSVPELTPMGSERHGAPDATAAVLWDERGIAVGGRDGLLHRPGGASPLEPVLCCSGAGEQRVAVHGDQVALWTNGARRQVFPVNWRFVEVRVDASARMLAGLASDGTGVHVFGASTGTWLFDAGPETHDSPLIEVAGAIVACMLPAGGLRWYDLQQNRALELAWVQTFALSGAGTWLALAGPDGEIRLVDPHTGDDTLPKILRPDRPPVHLLAFVGTGAELLVLDAEGNLDRYDLSASAGAGPPPDRQAITRLAIAADRMWGMSHGQRLAAFRIQSPETHSSTVLFVDLDDGAVVSEVGGLLPYVWVDPEGGDLLQPARGGAILEVDRDGNEQRVLRSLPHGEWIAFDVQGVLASSPAALG